VDTDWADLMLNNSAVRTEHTLSIAAGGEDTKYYLRLITCLKKVMLLPLNLIV
jgi:hypothetical protein